ncbi:hypothetical protein FOXYSP1_17099 [Fusarium oxysporum f. sp. phaseoli]
MAWGRRGTRTKRTQTAKGRARTEKRDRTAGPVPRWWRSAKVRFMSGQISFVNAQSSSSDMTDDPDRPESTSTNTSAKLYVDLFGPCLQCCASALRGKLSVYGLQASQLSRRSLHLPSFSPKRLKRNSGANLWSLNVGNL